MSDELPEWLIKKIKKKLEEIEYEILKLNIAEVGVCRERHIIAGKHIALEWVLSLKENGEKQ